MQVILYIYYYVNNVQYSTYYINTVQYITIVVYIISVLRCHQSTDNSRFSDLLSGGPFLSKICETFWIGSNLNLLSYTNSQPILISQNNPK